MKTIQRTMKYMVCLSLLLTVKQFASAEVGPGNGGGNGFLMQELNVSMTDNTLPLIQGETKIVSLQGKLATVERSSETLDDQETIQKCGATYSVLILDKPVRISLIDAQTDREVETVVQHFRIWGSPEVKAVNGAQVEIRGVVGYAITGLCSPGLAIQESSFYPLAE